MHRFVSELADPETEEGRETVSGLPDLVESFVDCEVPQSPESVKAIEAILSNDLEVSYLDGSLSPENVDYDPQTDTATVEYRSLTVSIDDPRFRAYKSLTSRIDPVAVKEFHEEHGDD